MDTENTHTKERSRALKICLIVLFFLFVVSACILGILLKAGNEKKSIGGFIDLSPDFGRNTRFVIIGGRVFYPNKEAVDFTFPKEPTADIAVEDIDDASDEIITLEQIDAEEDSDQPEDPAQTYKQYYSIMRMGLDKEVPAGNKDDVKWIELLTWKGGSKNAWTQEADIDLFRNDEGKLLSLAPGTEGYFRFQINNKSEGPVHAVMCIDEPKGGIHLPMLFALEDEKTGNKSPVTVLEKDDAVELSFDIDKDSAGVYRLNWRWPYESGDDAYDGLVGHKAGKYILNAKIYAETID